MPLCAILREQVDRTCAYLDSEEGRKELRRLQFRFALSYVGAIAQIAVIRCGIDRGEDIQAVTDEIVMRRLGVEVA